MISIIVPVYNTELYLRRCIDSILSQTFTDFELLLIDDGSSDSSGAICDEYATKDIRIKVFHKKNGGVSSARNVGLANAKGEWITFCDSDDRVYPSWLNNFELEQNSDYDFISQGFEADKSVFGEEKYKQRYIYNSEYEGYIADIMDLLVKSQRGGFLFISIFRQSIIQGNRLEFDERLKYAEDGVFIFKYLSYCNKAKGVNAIGYYYYVPNWSAKYIKNSISDIIAAKSLYESISNIMKDRPNDELLRFYREDLTSQYIKEFNKENSNKSLCLKELRAILKKYFRQSQLFYITKLVILIDGSYLLANLILRLHLKLKSSGISSN